MIISAKIIKKPKQRRYCEHCVDKLMDSAQVRLYGFAETGDKPYVIYICLECAKKSSDVQDTLKRTSQEFPNIIKGKK